jgi:hypothetical protein
MVALLAFALPACVSAVDDETPSASEATAASTSEALKVEGAAAGSLDASYQEYTSILESANLSAAPAGNSCTAACRCCKWGNTFCCKHCNWCTGPIKVSPSILSK